MGTRDGRQEAGGGEEGDKEGGLFVLVVFLREVRWNCLLGGLWESSHAFDDDEDEGKGVGG